MIWLFWSMGFIAGWFGGLAYKNFRLNKDNDYYWKCINQEEDK